MLGQGDCLLIETNVDKDGLIQAHLFVVVLEPREHTNATIIVNIETLRSRKQDQTTILRAGEHEFITSDSFVNYRRARIVSADDLDRLIEEGEAKVKPAVDPKVLERICDGVLRSPFIPLEVAEMYQDFLHEGLK